jgi:hypothetical protein
MKDERWHHNMDDWKQDGFMIDPAGVTEYRM